MEFLEGLRDPGSEGHGKKALISDRACSARKEHDFNCVFGVLNVSSGLREFFPLGRQRRDMNCKNIVGRS